ncbi:hypothetical protein [Bradyrhizobium sp. RT9a]|uniref:hypothetical protein n=1 Tax=Bradyrhizobium sp. RT9a TaxID=3156384 RepID=UPI0033942DBE
MRDDKEERVLDVAISEAMHKDSPRFRRATRFADLVQYLLSEFLPTERNCRHFIHRRLVEAGFAGNCEIINVPPECDEFDRLQLQRRMLELKAGHILVPTNILAVTKPQAAPALNIKSICESTKDRRCIEVWLADPVTAEDRAALTAALTRPEPQP